MSRSSRGRRPRPSGDAGLPAEHVEVGGLDGAPDLGAEANLVDPPGQPAHPGSFAEGTTPAPPASVDGESDLDEAELTEAEVTEDELVADEVERLAAKAPRPRRHGPLARLYRGETSFGFVGRRRWWYLASGVVILAGVLSLGVRGLNLGITFKGGTAWTVKAPKITQVEAAQAVQSVGLTQPTVEVLGSGGHEQVRVTADLSSLTPSARNALTTRVMGALARLTKAPPNSVSVTTVGPTWGGEVTQRAIIALIVFLAVVAAYISLRFEPKMALAAFIALLHDLLVTAGVYSLFGFQVTPDTVIAVLTILGYSLYDTVVVFDRVRDNTKGLGASGRMTYSQMVDLSMNQTLARSINTSLVAILPVLSVLLIGAELLGANTLQDYGLALVVGLVSGMYSSIFIASPTLAMFKEREPRYVAIRQRIESKGERAGLLTPSAAAAMLVGSSGAGGRSPGRPAKQGTLRPGQAKARAAEVAATAGHGTGSPRAPEELGVGVPAGEASTTLLRPGGANGSTRPQTAGNGRPGGARRPPARSRKTRGKRRR